MGRTAKEAVQEYLDAVRQWTLAGSLCPAGRSDGRNFQNYSYWKDEWTLRPADFSIEAVATGGNDHTTGQTMLVNVEMRGGRDVFKLYRDDGWEVKMSNNLWQVIPSDVFLELLTYDGSRLAYWPVSY
jgi:hypothetical protein